MTRVMSVLTVAVLAMAVGAQAPMNQQRKMSVDEKFLMDAASGGMLEVSMSQMAMERSTDANVKKIAQKMIDDHQKANQELMKIVQAKNMTLPQQPDQVHTAMLSKLGSETGEDFDECFLGMQVLAHEEALMCFRKEAKMGQDPQLKQFAEKTLPNLREHARMVRKANRNADDGDNRESLKPASDHR
ncbi:MAG: DUF4142 domain-containing protein [Gemmataceae bacterium]